MRSKALTRMWSAVLFAFVLFSCSATARYSAVSSTEPQWQHEWANGAVFYEIFVRSFSDSNGDGIGDLPGLISKLDYLNDGNPETKTDLGVNAIWLMPVFESPSYHGYDTTNYRKIEPDYGTDQDFRVLLEEAHKRGIRIIVDFMMNHSSSKHPWFLSSAASSSKRDWYVWRTANPGWTPPWGGSNPTWHPLNGHYYYGVFWSGMPDLNFRTPAVRARMKQTATFWLNSGVDGFRLDAARHLIENGPGSLQADTPETHAFWKEFSRHVRTTKPQSLLVGENWADTATISTYYGSTAAVAGGDELPMNFNFPLSEAILSAVQSGNASGISAKIAEMNSAYPAGVMDAPFLTNHDNIRIATQLKKNQAQLRNAAAILLTLPGAPFVYYGEEVGLSNGTTDGDESKRTPMPWNNVTGGGFTTAEPWFPFAPGRDISNVADQINDPASLLSLYRNLIQLRNQTDALRQGSMEMLTPAAQTAPVLAFLRRGVSDQILIAVNLTDTVAAAGPYSITAVSVERLFTDKTTLDPSGTSGRWSVNLPPHAIGIWRMR